VADLRATTIRQPYADLIIAGSQTVVNRTRPVPSTLPQWVHHPDASPTKRHRPEHECRRLGCLPDGPFPFRLGIHAAASGIKGPDLRAAKAAVRGAYEHDVTIRSFDRLGVLLGFVTVTGQHHADDCRIDVPGWGGFAYCSRWALPDRWHYTLADPQPLPKPIPMPGSAGLWRLEFELVEPA
jgi:hypothetical protein